MVVIPLLADYPAVKDLNPELVHDGQHWVLATRLIAAVRRTSLRRVGSVADQADPINRAVDVLMAGVSWMATKIEVAGLRGMAASVFVRPRSTRGITRGICLARMCEGVT